MTVMVDAFKACNEGERVGVRASLLSRGMPKLGNQTERVRADAYFTFRYTTGLLVLTLRWRYVSWFHNLIVCVSNV